MPEIIKTWLIVDYYYSFRKKPNEIELLPIAKSSNPICKIVLRPKQEIKFEVTTVPINLVDINKVGTSSFSYPDAIFSTIGPQ